MSRRPGTPNPPRLPLPPEVERLRLLLRALMNLAGLNHREVQRRVAAQGHPFDVLHTLAGKQEIKVWHVLAVCQAIGVHPAEIFRMLLPEPVQPSPLVAEVTALVRPPRPDGATAAVAGRLLQSVRLP